MNMAVTIPPVTDHPQLAFVEVPREEWDMWILARNDSTPFHRNAWGEGVEAATGHAFKCYGLKDASGAIVAGVPVHFIRSLLFGKAAASAGFAVDGGVLADNAEAAQLLIDAVWALPEVQASGSLELRGGVMPADNIWHIKSETYAGFATPLAADDEAQLLAIPRKQRAEVRKALAGLEAGDYDVVTGNDDVLAREHYAVYAESVRNLGTPVFPKKLFDEIRRRFGDEVDILTVRKADGTPLASVLSLYHKGVVMPYWGGGTFDARAARANELMYYKLMCHARVRGCDRFDFGRSKVGTGAYAYKKNWGMEPQALTYAVRTASGEEPRDINPLSPKYQKKIQMWQKLPLWVANSVGPFIARGLG